MADVQTSQQQQSASEPTENYDIFIAHSSEDKDISYEILETLEKTHRKKCFHSDRDFMPGQSIVNNALQGIEQSRRVLVIVSEAFLKSTWFIFEVQQTLQKMYEGDRQIIIPVLFNVKPDQVPASLKEFNYLTWGEERFWERLLSTLQKTIPLSSAIPAGNVAHGLAWSYFYGFLKLVLPGMADRVQASEWAKDPKWKDVPILPKMLIILPRSCYCPGRFLDLDQDSFEFSGAIPFNATRAGNINRDYKSSVYRVKCPDTGKVYHFLGEFATPLLSLYEMEQGEISGLNHDQKLHQMLLFQDKLREILEHPHNAPCHDKTIMIRYDDTEGNREDHALARQIIRTIQHDLDKQSEVSKMAGNVETMEM